MGNFASRDGARMADGPAPIQKFYSQNAWIEGRAEDRLRSVAALPGVKAIAAFPDLHPGKYGPVGCAVLSEMVHPNLVGGDIGCGMSLFMLDIPARRMRVEKTSSRLRALEGLFEGNADDALQSAGLPGDLYPSSLGTIGSGNHFCEVQTIADAGQSALDATRAYLLVHSGSRGLGQAIMARYLAASTTAVAETSQDGAAYLGAHDQAVRWAALNRYLIAQRAAKALRADMTLIVCSPHNFVEQTPDGWLHRKGAAAAAALTPLAGTRATPSFLLAQTSSNPLALNSSAHGAGRKFDRSSMHGRIRAKKSNLRALSSTPYGGRVICEDKRLLVEEAPQAYKSAAQVAADLSAAGLFEIAATFHPLVTFKKADRGVRS